MKKNVVKASSYAGHVQRPIDVYIGLRLKQKRLSKELSVDMLEAESGIGIGSMLNFESGNVTIKVSQLLILAEILDIPLSYFYN